jgi:hypothetical protein
MAPNIPAAATPALGEDALIADRYAIDLNEKLEGAGGGLTTFAATDTRSGRGSLMAVQVAPNAPPRADALTALMHVSLPGVLTPLAHGPGPTSGGGQAYYIVCAAPPGPSLAEELGTWEEEILFDQVLRPIASTLEELRRNGVTHRAIRPDNVFGGGEGFAMMLGCAWASPPGSLQPALFEPPYSAMCLPAGRGNGTIADDVYALGVLMVMLARGEMPMAGLAPGEVIRRKLEFGCYGAIVGEARLPPLLADLVRGMLAADPTHRPPPTLLLDPSAARGRRLAVRPPRSAQKTLPVGDIQVSNVRTLAYAIALYPEEGVRLLRGGSLDTWLRRSLGDTTLATTVDETVRQRVSDGSPGDVRADSALAMRVVAMLDPLAPLAWQGIAIWPDGLGPALAAARGAVTGPRLATSQSARLESIVEHEAIGQWAVARPQMCDVAAMRTLARHHRTWSRIRGDGGGTQRLLYMLNPLLPCSSNLLSGSCVARLPDLLPALERASADKTLTPFPPIDPPIAAFIAARQEPGLTNDGSDLDGDAVGHSSLKQIRLLASLQSHLTVRPLPGLAAWLVEHAAPMVEQIQNRQRRAKLQATLKALAEQGHLTPLVAVLDDPTERDRDAQGLRQAEQVVARIDAELARIVASPVSEKAKAREIGNEVAAGLGLTILAFVLAITVLG